MSSSTDAEKLTLQLEGLSIENDKIVICAACGKESEEDSMNICNKCKMVYYCNVTCKKKHKSKHKKKCERRAAELHDEALFKEPQPREECPICMLPLPADAGETLFKVCCGKTICLGCIHAITIEERRKGKKNEEIGMCPYCRTPRERSEEEAVERLKKLMENGNAKAFYIFAGYYNNGSHGFQQDMAKANELWPKAGELGCAEAYSKLGYSYHVGRGAEVDEKKAKHYYELAAMKGDVHARYNLGALEHDTGNYHRAYKHAIIAARAGHEKALSKIKLGFQAGCVAKDEYASTLRAYHESQTEMKSKAREAAKAYS